MAIEIGCACDSGNGNTGLPDCTSLFGVAKGLGMQNMVAKDGTENKIDLSVASIGTVFSDLLRHIKFSFFNILSKWFAIYFPTVNLTLFVSLSITKLLIKN